MSIFVRASIDGSQMTGCWWVEGASHITRPLRATRVEDPAEVERCFLSFQEDAQSFLAQEEDALEGPMTDGRRPLVKYDATFTAPAPVFGDHSRSNATTPQENASGEAQCEDDEDGAGGSRSLPIRSVWRGTFMMQSDGSSEKEVEEHFCLRIDPPESGDEAGTGKSTPSVVQADQPSPIQPSFYRCRVIAEGSNELGYFCMIGSYVADTGEILCEKHYLVLPTSLPSAQRPAGGPLPPGNAARAGLPPLGFDEVPRSVVEEDLSAAGAQLRQMHNSRAGGRRGRARARLDMVTDSVVGAEGTEWFAAHLLGQPAKGLAGELYEGEMLDGMPHGFGSLIYRNGYMYEGSFVQGKEHGWGVLSDPEDKVIYEGEVVESEIQGTGTFSFPDGSTYAGQWKAGLFDGRGVFSRDESAARGCYDGEWREGQRHGQGKMTYEDGSWYEGQWCEGKREGRGTLRHPSGFSYTGTWENDTLEGRGDAVYPDGSTYEGPFKAGQREGRGTYKFANGATYNGRWKEDEMIGSGNVEMQETVQARNTEWFIPLNLQTDVRRMHLRAGFSREGD